MALGADNGLQTWCYDAIRQRSWNWVSCNVVLRRTADLVWIEFTGHPSRFCSDVLAVQSIEAFLTGGAPVEAPVDVVASIRDHLLSLRSPGPSTWLEIAVELQGNDACHLVRACLRQNGESLENVPIPGPDYAGLYGWPLPGRKAHTLRLLVDPGPVAVQVELSVDGPPAGKPWANRIERAFLDLDAVAPAHVRTAVRMIVDASGWPSLTVTATVIGASPA